ncbi:NAD(P)H-dependent oxidoreductase [Couchioplanes caeruleus]|uniref:NADPH-dependent FMN reductase n=1 Tax=Couchioplanes caeruleus TaxID=56438 RepID=UPI0020BEF09B|nr:NAD(P)H-dependent oxidoreductase [Couchioplanes caeruleus]UQU65111.1 NAD(P)H-dependent oxidoreductase [Couchioplanes caeruleus]
MDTTPLRVAVIVGSTREGRFGPTVAAWIAGLISRRSDLKADLIDPAATTPTARVPAEDRTVTEALGLADAFVVVTPEYNHSYPAPLKALIDGHFGEWRAKPIAFVSYGGLSGGLRAVEHLRPVFAELHAVTVRDTVSFHGARQCFGGDGLPVDPGSTVAAERMLDGLTWWGNSLRDARVLRPYPMGA